MQHQGAEAVYDAKGAMAKATVHYRPLIFCTQHNTFQQVTKKTIHKKPVDEINKYSWYLLSFLSNMIPPAVLIIGIQGQSQSNSQYSPCQNLQRRVSHILLKLLLKYLRIELKRIL